MNEDVLTQSATELLGRMRGGELSSSDLIQMSLERIEAINPRLNAVVALDRERARDAAAEADRRWKEGAARPLEGLPVTIKDSFDVEAMPATAGSPLYRDRKGAADAPAVARLREAGAIIVGKTNVSEMLADLQSSNPLFGATSNPHGLTRSAGGSSGGSAAAVASGLSTLDLGSDLCGSIRWPAHCCGLFALKPGWGTVPMYGHVPPPPGATAPAEISTGGPFARSAADLRLAYSVLSGRTLSFVPLDRRPLRVAVWTEEALAPSDPEVLFVVMEAARRLQEAGAIVDHQARPAFGFAEAFEVFSLLAYRILALGLTPEARATQMDIATRLLPGDLSHAALRARGAALDDRALAELNRRRQTLARAWGSFFVEWDVVLCPPAPRAAIAHDLAADIHARTVRVNGHDVPYFHLTDWCCLASVADLPSAIVPFPATDQSLPLGVQIISAAGEEAMALAVADRLERSGFSYRSPTMIWQS
ncbi:MAG: amidase family protein [Aliihoeflea sp.]